MAKKEIKVFTYDSSYISEELLDKEKKGIKYISKKRFEDEMDNEDFKYRIVGRTKLKKYKEDKHKDESYLVVDEDKYLVDNTKKFRIKGYIPVGGGIYLEYRKLNLVLIILFSIVSLALLLGLFYLISTRDKGDKILPPDNPIVEVEQQPIDEEKTKYLMIITLPEGDVEFDGDVFIYGSQTELLNDSVNIKAFLMNENVENLIYDDGLKVSEGKLPDSQINYLIQKAELISGIYSGRIEITYPDGNTTEESLTIVIRDSYGGTMDIGYSPDVNVNLASGDITFKYLSGYTATHDVVAQIILKKNGNEYLLAETGRVSPGNEITHANLKEGMNSRITEGQYSGVIRLNFYTEKEESDGFILNTDIEVTIIVQ